MRHSEPGSQFSLLVTTLDQFCSELSDRRGNPWQMIGLIVIRRLAGDCFVVPPRNDKVWSLPHDSVLISSHFIYSILIDRLGFSGYN